MCGAHVGGGFRILAHVHFADTFRAIRLIQYDNARVTAESEVKLKFTAQITSKQTIPHKKYTNFFLSNR